VKVAILGRFSRVRLVRCAILAALAGATLLAGCGQRGPLYLPDQPPPKKRVSQSPAPGPVQAVLPRAPSPRS
jgi:predicted small lipoprotein YifL